nr:serine/threonine-protein phosphatase [Propionibacterium sp.]
MTSFRFTAHSEIGLVRKNNQDSAYASPTMIVVADGMGGAAAGDLASAVAIEALAATDAHLAELRAAAAEERPAVAPSLPEGPAGDVLAILAETLDAANRRLNELVASDPALEGMGTTVCGFTLVDDATAALVNIGDSRAYVLRDGVLTRVSRDHSWVQTLVDEGRITEREALEHPHRSLILRVLNGKPQHEPEFSVVEVRAGDRLLVCSDGLCGLVTDAEIAGPAAIDDREAAVASLVDLAHEAGGYDNITIVLADVVTGEPEGTPTTLGAAANRPAPGAATGVLGAVAAGDAAPTAATPDDGDAPNPEDARYALRVRTGRQRLRTVLGVIIPVLLLVGGAFGWYSYTQTRYYIGPTYTGATPRVALYQGIPDRLLGAPLSHVVAEGPELGDLPPASVEKVTRTFAVDTADAGRAALAQLKLDAEQCVAQREARIRASQVPVTPSPSPSPAAPGTPGADGPSTAPLPSPTPVSTPVAPGEC